jgi:ribosomal protein L40E
MGYLICKECGMQYKLKEGETAEDFEDCECGGDLKEVENLENINDTKPNTPAKEIKYSSWTGKPIIDKSNSSKGVYNENIKKKLEARRKGLDINNQEPLAPIKPDKTTNSQDIICQKCGTKNPYTAKFCTECASPLSDKASKKFCSQCGTENPPEAQYCQECATNLKSPVVQQKGIPQDKDKGLSGGETVVVCLFSPIAGALGYLIWHDEKPEKAKQACIIAVLAFVIIIMAYLLFIYSSYFSRSPIDSSQDISQVRGSIDSGYMILTLFFS